MAVLPPEGAVEAEQAVLGSLLIDPDIAPYLFSTAKPNDFIFDKNRAIFTVARDMYRKGEPIDIVTVNGALLKANMAELYDTTTGVYLSQLMEITPTSANWKQYAQIMRDKTAIWRIKTAASDLSTRAKDIDDCRQYAETINALLNQRHVHKPHTLQDSMGAFLDMIDNPPPVYLNYGIPELDRMMYTERGDVVVIGGSPSSGKTALALSIALNLGQSRKVAFFSLETNSAKLNDRLMAHNAKVKFSDIKTRAIMSDEKAWERIASVVVEKQNNGFSYFTSEDAPLTFDDIENLTRVYGYEAVFIDYVQLLLGGYQSRYGNIRERITEISMRLHSFAQSTKTTVFELAQLSRQPKGGWEEPTMFDLKESGQLEQDADAVLLLYRPPKTHKFLDENKNRFLKVAKNKEGVTGSLILDFDGETQSFSVHKNDSAIMRDLADAGRAAKNRNRMEAQDAYYQSSLDDSDMPF